MARKKKRSTKKKKKTGSWSLRSLVPPMPDWSAIGESMPPRENVFKAARITGWALCLAVVAGSLAWGVPRLEAYAIEYAGDYSVQVELVDQPAWVSGNLERKLHMTAIEQLQGDPLDRSSDDLENVREALLDTGWFTQIEQVHRRHLDLIEVHGRFARPHALIRDTRDELDYLIDPEGRLLPHAFRIGDAVVEYPVIVGTARPRPPRTGEKWPGADVDAALSLLEEILAQEWRSQVEAVDVSRYLSDQRLDLLTDRGVRIIWGRAPNDVSMGEVSTEEKIAYLTRLYEIPDYRRIDGGFTGTELDIRGLTASQR